MLLLFTPALASIALIGGLHIHSNLFSSGK